MREKLNRYMLIVLLHIFIDQEQCLLYSMTGVISVGKTNTPSRTVPPIYLF